MFSRTLLGFARRIKTVTSRHGVLRGSGGIHQDTEARAVLEAEVPLIIVQLPQDYFCNAPKYVHWYGRIMQAVSAGRAKSSFFFLNLPGDHDCAEKLATQSQWEEHGPELGVVWQSFWTAVTGVQA